MKFPPFRTIALAFIAGFFAVQIVSILVSTLFPSIPLLQGGPIILIFLLGIAVMSLFILGIRYDELKKENLIFVLLIFGLLVAAYYALPKYLPGLFSISPETSEVIKNTIGNIVNGG